MFTRSVQHYKHIRWVNIVILLLVVEVNGLITPSNTSASSSTDRIINRSTNSMEIGPNDFRISDMRPGGSAVASSIAYNHAADEYLVVWEGTHDVNDEIEIYGQRLNASGQEIGPNDFRISDMGSNDSILYAAFAPTVTYNSTTDEYLVVWLGDNTINEEFEIYGQRLNASGQEIGPNDFRISDMGPEGDALRKAVAYNHAADEYLVVWEGTHDVNDEFEIYGQRLNASGQEIGPNDFRISDMGPEGATDYDAYAPTVTYHSMANEYLVAWHGTDTIVGEFEIYGQRLNASGQEIGPNDFRISDMGPEGATIYGASNPVITYHNTTQEYLVVWYGTNTTVDEFEIYGQRLAIPPQWLVLLYVGADDAEVGQTGQSRTSLDESVGSLRSYLDSMDNNPAMHLVMLVDRGGTGDSAIYERLPRSTQLISITQEVIDSDEWEGDALDPDIMEFNTGSTVTLQNVIRWSRRAYPDIPYTFLSIIDHGGGWSPDFGNGVQPPGKAAFQAGGWRGLSFDATSDSSFSTRDTSEALDALGSLGEVDVLFLDACLMGMVESVYEVRDYAEYVIAGENLLWAQFGYDQYFSRESLTYTTTPRDLATSIVAQYNQPASSFAPVTIAAIDTDQLPAVKTQVESLATALLTEWNQASDPTTIETAIRTAYQQTQKFDYDSNLQIDPTDGYVDLAHFAQMLRRQDVSAAVNTAADAVNQVVANAVIAKQTVSGTPFLLDTPWDFTNANGLSIYLPLGERDCRPTGQRWGADDPSCQPTGLPMNADDLAVENQLKYYALPEQLQFTRDAPSWAALLTRLDTTTTRTETSGGITDIPVRNLEERPFYSPLHMRSWEHIYLPFVE